MNDAFPDVRTRSGLTWAALVGAVGVAGSYALAGNTTAFVVAPVDSLVVDLMPAPVLTFSILVLGEVGDLLGFLLAFALAIAALGAVTLLAFWLGRRYGAAAALGGVYFGGWGLAVLLTRAPWTGLGVALPMTAAVALVAVGPLDRRSDLDESRRWVVRAAGALGFSAVAYAVGNRSIVPGGRRTPPRLTVIPAAEQAAIKRRLDAADRGSLGVPGIDGLVSPVGSFYRVDVDAVDPSIDPGRWTLSVSGAVDRERTLTYDDLTSRPPTHRFATLRCVGEPLNGDLMDTALWTGVPVDDVLADAGVGDVVTHVRLHADDGYYETVPLEALRGGFLAYGMNGYVLPRSHGYPVRALVPGHWGEVNVKWLTEIELLQKAADSYWEQRGWHGTGPVNTVAKLHAQHRLRDGRIQVGGHAYAGTRGIRSVQVSTDGGSTWDEARLSTALPDPDTWRQWAHTYQPPDGAHEVVVRAVDGEGTLQPRTRAQAFPGGASGWVSVRVTP